MSDVSAVQPSFFEGQYLGADDLAAIVEYFRTQGARRMLSSNTWGIAAGLQLVATDIGGGDLQISVSPGVAVDGYGRLIVVTTPAEIPAEKLLGIGTGQVKIWVRYAQTPIRSFRQGFNVCQGEDAYAGIEESFEIEVGERTGIVDRQSGASVAGALVADAREAAHSTDDGAPLHCDGTVPYQEFPIDDEDSLWLVPLGVVNWNSVSSAFQALSEDQQVAARIFRRQMGAVAEVLHAANGLIRLRDRATEFQVDINAACAETSTTAADYFVCDGTLKARELVWLEGSTRVTGDLRLFGTRLEFRDDTGRDYVDRTVNGVAVAAAAPLLMDRAGNGKDGVDLRVLLGESQDGRNRFAIGPAQVSGTSLCDVDVAGSALVVVQDDGRVGIGTAGTPDSDLSAPLTIRGTEDTVTVTASDGSETGESVWRLVNLEDAAGDVRWQLDFWTDGESLAIGEVGAEPGTVYLAAGGNVGIGTTAPEARLEVARTPTGASGGLGNNLWFRLGDGGENGDGGRVWVEYGAQQAPLLVLSDHDDPPRLQFQQTGAGGDEFAPDHATWIGHLTGTSEDFGIVGGGRIGLRTETPYTSVTVDGTVGFKAGTEPLVFMFESGTSNPDRMVFSHSPGFVDWGIKYVDVDDRFVFQRAGAGTVLSVGLASGRVGVGTDAPAAALDVRGSVKLGGAGDLFALGAGPDLRVVAGEVNSDGSVARGSGFSSSRTGTGAYQINFTPAFAGIPFVIATGFGDADNVVSISGRTASLCTVRTFDVENVGQPAGNDDQAFMFIAMGAR